MEVRNPDISFDNIPMEWARNIEFAQRWNATSIAAPHAETYVNRTMLLCKGKLAKNDPLREDIDIFVKQESNHLRIHNLFNDRFRKEMGEDMLALERELRQDFQTFLKDKPLAWNAAYAAGFESSALFMAEYFFTSIDDLLDGADRNAVGLFRWHLAEEYEHRAVCYDVYKTLFGGYFLRIKATWFVFKHLGNFGARMTTLFLERSRAGMTPEERAASEAREKGNRQRFLRFVMPRMLHLLSPFYDPKKAAAPRGITELLDRLGKLKSPGPQPVTSG
ncbi:metal-dependent hydrolase [Sphingomonadaceae bacterium G21617-S1]|nr:metal-dependent hydrolase [Sphingomonadaceae bacterium G21617-S1]